MNSKAFFTSTISLGIVIVIFAASINSVTELNLSESELFAQQINETNRLWQNAYFELANGLEWNEDCTAVFGQQQIIPRIEEAFGEEGSECEISITSEDNPNVSFTLTCRKRIPLTHGFGWNTIEVSKPVTVLLEFCSPIEETEE
jgi:hypothetical protein